jgi:hypothetical protein
MTSSYPNRPKIQAVPLCHVRVVSVQFSVVVIMTYTHLDASLTHLLQLASDSFQTHDHIINRLCVKRQKFVAIDLDESRL